MTPFQFFAFTWSLAMIIALGFFRVFGWPTPPSTVVKIGLSAACGIWIVVNYRHQKGL